MPSCPSKGARTCFLVIKARMLSTDPCFCPKVDCAASSSCFETTFPVARPCVRCKFARANSKSASAVCNCASSADESSFNSTSPFFASPPFWKLTCATTPPSSVETTAPWTAETEPIAESTGAQSSSFATALGTVVGGIIIGVLIILPICIALIPKRITRSSTRPAIAFVIGLRTNLIFFLATDFAMSCIRWFAFRLKQKSPQPPGDVQLTRPSLLIGHLLRLQDVVHQHSASDRKY